jgi:phage N-6-adenine-methyltransferase
MSRLRQRPPAVAAWVRPDSPATERPDLGSHVLRQGRAVGMPARCNPGNWRDRGVHLAFEQRFLRPKSKCASKELPGSGWYVTNRPREDERRHVTELAKYVAAEKMLAEIASPQDAMRVIDFAEAARVYALQMGHGLVYINYAQMIKQCAQIRLAEVIDEGQAAGVIARRGRVPKSQEGSAISPDDIAPRSRLQEARKLAKKYTPDQIRAIADACTAAGEEMSRRKLNSEAVQQSITNQWYTPAPYLDAARAVLGGFDLDPASCAEANEMVKAERFLTAEDDGLSHDWHGRVWLNPPYGKLAGHFVVRLDDQYEFGNVIAAITLVNAHCTDTAWFQPLWDHTLCFTNHRINFDAGTADRSGSTHGSVFAYMGPDPATFAAEFSQFGAILRRWP